MATSLTSLYSMTRPGAADAGSQMALLSGPKPVAGLLPAPKSVAAPATADSTESSAVSYSTTGSLRADVAVDESRDADLALAESTVSAARKTAEAIGDLLQEVLSKLAAAESSADRKSRELQATVDELMNQVASMAASASFGAVGKLVGGSSAEDANATITGATAIKTLSSSGAVAGSQAAPSAGNGDEAESADMALADQVHGDTALLVEQAAMIQAALRLELGRAASAADSSMRLAPADLGDPADLPIPSDGEEWDANMIGSDALWYQQPFAVGQHLTDSLARLTDHTDAGVGQPDEQQAPFAQAPGFRKQSAAERHTGTSRHKRSRPSTGTVSGGAARPQLPTSQPTAASPDLPTTSSAEAARENLEAMLRYVLNYARALRSLQMRLANRRVLMRKLAQQAGRTLGSQLDINMTPAKAQLQSWRTGQLLTPQGAQHRQ